MQKLYKLHDFDMKLSLYLNFPRFANKKIIFPRSQGRPQFPKILEKIPRSGNPELHSTENASAQ